MTHVEYRMAGRVMHTHEEYQALQDANARLRAEIKQLRTALEHFADTTNWWEDGLWACNTSPWEVAQWALGPVQEPDAA